jgi:hypothetical protein
LTPRLRRAAAALLVLWVASVAYLTLTPTGYGVGVSRYRFFCVACGELDGSDMLRNWILFVPGGLLAAIVLGRWRALALGLGFTALIEFVQVGIPGRDPAVQDLLLNALGALTGVVVMRRGLGRWTRHAVAATAALTWLVPLVLLIPETTPHDLYGQWTPRFGGSGYYQGRILNVSVGGLVVPSWKFDDKAPLDSALVRRATLHVVLEAGPVLARRAPVFQIADAEENAILELHALGPDLILRGWNPARILKLDQPDVRWPGAMDGVAAGDTVTIVVDRGRDSVCMSVDDRERCNLAPSLADGWGFVLYLEGPPLWFRQLMSAFWALGLGGLIGLTARSWRQALAFTTALAVVGYGGTLVSPDVRPSVAFSAVLVLGALAGALLRRPVVWLWRELRPTA